MRAFAVVSVFAMTGVLFAQVVLTPVNQDALLMSNNTNVFSLSNATQIVSCLKLGMAQTNVDRHMNAHGMTNRGSLSLDRGACRVGLKRTALPVYANAEVERPRRSFLRRDSCGHLRRFFVSGVSRGRFQRRTETRAPT